MVGRVVSTKMEKTAVVLITRNAIHPLYKKTFVRSKKYLADDPIGVKEGDLVEIVNIKPVSKDKHWRVTKVLGRDIKELVKEQLEERAAESIAEVMPEEPDEEEEGRVEGISKASLFGVAKNVGSSEETENMEEKKEPKKKRIRKEKLAPKP